MGKLGGYFGRLGGFRSLAASARWYGFLILSRHPKCAKVRGNSALPKVGFEPRPATKSRRHAALAFGRSSPKPSLPEGALTGKKPSLGIWPNSKSVNSRRCCRYLLRESYELEVRFHGTWLLGKIVSPAKTCTECLWRFYCGGTPDQRAALHDL